MNILKKHKKKKLKIELEFMVVPWNGSPEK